MTTNKRRGLTRPFAVCVLWALTAVAADAERLTCAFDQGPTRFYIAKTINLDQGDFGRVKVTDAVIASTGRTEVFGDIAAETAKRLSVTWEVQGVKANPNEYRFYDAHLLYRLTMQRATGSATLFIQEATPYNTSTYRSTGKCRSAN